MSEIAPLFIHPLLDGNDAWAGYLAERPDGRPASRSELECLLEHPDFAAFDGRHPWLFPNSGKLLPDLPGSERIVALQFAPPPPAEAPAPLPAARNALAIANGSPLAAAGAWEFLLVRAGHARTEAAGDLHHPAGKPAIIISDVVSQADRDWVLSRHIPLCTGEYLISHRTQGRRADITRLKLLELLALITHDADTAAIEAVLRQEPKLAYSLLRLVNSAANAPRSPVTSFAQAINLLGRRQLQRWLQLLVYADPNDNGRSNPLLLKAAARGRLLEILVPALYPDAPPASIGDIAFMVGSFSLLDVLLGMPLPELLRHLPVPPLARAALLEHDGPLGALLRFVAAAEARDFSALNGGAIGQPVSGAAYFTAQISALAWASALHAG